MYISYDDVTHSTSGAMVARSTPNAEVLGVEIRVFLLNGDMISHYIVAR